MNVGAYFDISNLYYRSNKVYGKKISYRKLMEHLTERFDVQCIEAKAYGAQLHGGATGFIRALEKLGMEVHFNEVRSVEPHVYKADCDVEITVDMCRDIGKYEAVILGTSDGDFQPAIEYLRERGIYACVAGMGVSRVIRADEIIELGREFLEDE